MPGQESREDHRHQGNKNEALHFFSLPKIRLVPSDNARAERYSIKNDSIHILSEKSEVQTK